MITGFIYTELPEFKGRLVSTDDLNNIIKSMRMELGILAEPISNIFEKIVNSAPTIIEANKTESKEE